MARAMLLEIRMKAFLFIAFLALVPALADRLWGAPVDPPPQVVAAISSRPVDERIVPATDGQPWRWLCATRS